MNKDALNYCKNELLRLQEHYDKVLHRPMSGAEPSKDLIDSACNELQIHTSAYFRSQMMTRLSQIKEALQSIEDGSYGICKITGKTIAEKRLKAVPWTLLSIDAAV